MSEDKRKNARTQGRYSSGDKEFTSRRPDKQNSKMSSSADKNKGDKRKPPPGPRAQKELDFNYKEVNKYSFKDQLEPAKKPRELRFNEPMQVISTTKNGESRLLYNQNFMKLAEADEYMKILYDSTKWSEKNIIVRGVECKQPRLVAWYGPHPYAYAGATLEAKEMPTTVLEIKEKVEENLRQHNINVDLNSVLLNLYRNEKDSVAWHSDDEFSLGVCPTIASVSLGAVRKFEMRPKQKVANLDTDDILYVNLTHGSLIVMDGCMQKDWQHRVPKAYHDTTARINLTFRTIYPIDQLPPEIPAVSNPMSVRASSSKVVQDHKYDEENFPPLGMEVNDKKSKVLPKEASGRDNCQPLSENWGKDYQQSATEGKVPESEIWDEDILQNVESAQEIQGIHTHDDLNEKSRHDAMIDSPELSPSQTDSDLNTQFYNLNLSANNDYGLSNSETFEPHNCESNNVYECQSNLVDPSKSISVKIKDELLGNDAEASNSGKKYSLNANAPIFLPQNKFEKYSLFEFEEYCSNNHSVEKEDLNSFMEALFSCLLKNKSYFYSRDFNELSIYFEINDGTLSERNLRIILGRIGFVIHYALSRSHDTTRYPRNPNRSYDDRFRKPRQTYTQSRRY